MLVTKEIQEKFNQAKNIIFMTGAGVSTLSGIPDYRSKNGVYQGLDLSPEYLLSDQAFEEIPEIQYQFMQENLYFPAAQPNIIHKKMAGLTKQGRAKIITQNIDDLDVKAGADNNRLIRFHGTLYRLYAPVDGKEVSLETYQQSLYRPGDHAKIRPAITFYGEQPYQVGEAIDWVSQADLIVVVGTSFKVYPFAGLLAYASPAVQLLAVNLTAIPVPSRVQQIVGDAGQFFEELQI
ncbi:Sir2 family NAD-dependent protein deacetylase [Fructobacillus pseudoficulneus]|uniref:protein acetyllysine N-acetyltransferase n=1 Tax=Fructobacillus pseudoficulneus TaxID=220714 RepID=A0A3F3GUL7_9LACO|nr:NAD-dependent protein deacylase [Fructobacillus pseudoficulneus]GAP03055.1 Sir2 family NAD-dependent protein deacetylase [Fructobacillus pseudoficulneus]SEH41733.1 NAD-dependent deacetylase [Fructobacillus pseudoficulneus]